MINEKLRIFQWNCRAISKRSDLLQQYLSKEDHHILLLQSIHCTRAKLPKIPGYFYPPVIDFSTSSNQVNVAIYVRDDLEYHFCKSPVPLDSDNVFSTSVTLKLKDNKCINLASIYYPRGPNNEDSDWLKNTECNKDLWVIGGDFNCHSKLWGKNSKKNTSDRHFSDNVIDSSFILLNNGNITRVPDALDHAPSALDLTFVSPDLAIDHSWEIVEDTMGNDHFPIVN